MKKYLLMALCLFSSSLIAEQVGNIEFNFPNDQEWKVGNEMNFDDQEKNIKSTITIFTQKDIEFESATELFMVTINNQKVFDSDEDPILRVEAALDKAYQQISPTFKAYASIIEKDSDSILYEWSIKNDGNEFIHGWARGLYSSEGSGAVGFQTCEIGKLEEMKVKWIPVLKEAKIAN